MVAMVWLLTIGGWVIFAVTTFGSFVPQSVIAKAATADDPALVQFSWTNLALFFLKGQDGGDIFERTYLQLMPVASTLSALSAAAMIWDVIRIRTALAVRRALALLCFPGSYVAGLAFSHAFTFYPWYYGPIYPFVAALAVLGVATRNVGHVRLVAGACTLLVSGQLVAGWLVKLPADRSFWVEGFMRAADVVPRNTEVVVAASEIGAVGWRNVACMFSTSLAWSRRVPSEFHTTRWSGYTSLIT